jgi:hypothetical protein
MYDTSFDFDRKSIPTADRRMLWALRIGGVLLVILAASAGAQMPNTPVLQNVWANPGLVGAVNLAGGSAGSIYAAAASWSPAAGRFQFSGGLGFSARTAGLGSGFAYGARVAMPLASPASSFGVGFFAGVGGSSSATRTVVDSLTADSTRTASTQVPVGVAFGWRRGIGATHGFSLYASPSYAFASGGGTRGGVVRAAFGADVGITQSIGATAGLEIGQARARTGGPSGTLWGFGVSYAFGR